MADSLGTQLKQGMAQSFAAQTDPDRPMVKEYSALQISTLRDDAVKSRFSVLEMLEKKIELLKAQGADGRSIQTYQRMHEELGNQVVGLT